MFRIIGKPLPAKAMRVLEEVLEAAGLTSADVSSVVRDAGDQARVMYENVVTRGVAVEKQLYGPFGRQVIDVYEANQSESRRQVIALMKNKIIEIGPSNVSKHCSTTHYVWDVKPSSIADQSAFVHAAENHPLVTKFLKPPSDPAYHFEVPK